MQRKSNLIEILGLLIGAASLALALGEPDNDIRQPVTSPGTIHQPSEPSGYTPPRHRYREYYEPKPCDPYYCDCPCY